jgi:cytoskeletal protein RodZ
MADQGFTRKKVASLTLGEKLKKLRGDFRVSLHDVSKATKIQMKYLEALEAGEYEKLPAEVYIRGFLRSYARYLNVDERIFVKLYERERNIQQNLGGGTFRHARTKEFPISSIVVTPRSIIITITAVLVVGAFYYLYQQFESFAGDPRLVILEPSSGAVIETSETVIKGKTDKGARVSINNQPVFVGSDGEFSDTLILQPGINTITVVTVNRFDKEKSETVSVEAHYLPAPPDPLPTATSTAFSADIRTTNPKVVVTVTADGTVVFNGTLSASETRHIEIGERMTLSSDDGSKTFVHIGSGQEEVLSSVPGPVKEAVFTKEGKQL